MAREGDEDGGGGQADPERCDDERLGTGGVGAPHVERAGKGRRSKESEEDPEVAGLQRPASAPESARGARAETDPADHHDDGQEHDERDHRHHRLACLVRPDSGDERCDPDDQLAMPDHRRRGELPGLGKAWQCHADRGERGKDGMPGFDRDPAEQRVHTEGDRDEADHHQQRQDEIAPGRGDASVGEVGLGLDREHDEHAENERDGEVRQVERPERGDRVPGRRETSEAPPQDGGCGDRPRPGAQSGRRSISERARPLLIDQHRRRLESDHRQGKPGHDSRRRANETRSCSAAIWVTSGGHVGTPVRSRATRPADTAVPWSWHRRSRPVP